MPKAQRHRKMPSHELMPSRSRPTRTFWILPDMNGYFGQIVWICCIGSGCRIEAFCNEPCWWNTVIERPRTVEAADLLTRGLRVCTLIDNEGWWKGPAFLRQEETEWSETKIATKNEADLEVRLRGPQAAPRTLTVSVMSFHSDRRPLD